MLTGLKLCAVRINVLPESMNACLYFLMKLCFRCCITLFVSHMLCVVFLYVLKLKSILAMTAHIFLLKFYQNILISSFLSLFIEVILMSVQICTILVCMIKSSYTFNLYENESYCTDGNPTEDWKMPYV